MLSLHENQSIWGIGNCPPFFCKADHLESCSRWWFQIFVYFRHYLGKRSNLTQIFQRGGSTTNQGIIFDFITHLRELKQKMRSELIHFLVEKPENLLEELGKMMITV